MNETDFQNPSADGALKIFSRIHPDERSDIGISDKASSYSDWRNMASNALQLFGFYDLSPKRV